MQFLKKTTFFVVQYVKIMKKKWLRLLLLFVFPFILLSLILTVFISVLIPSETNPITIGFVDEDRTDETGLFSMLIDSGEALDATFISIQSMSEMEAVSAMEEDDISLYFTFPKGFTDSLYEGESITVPLVGNPNRPLDSLIVKELLDSLTRYIGTSQASILTINDYAKELEMPGEERQDYLFDNFIEFTFFVLGKDKMVEVETLVNTSSESPMHYYAVAAWFIAFSMWVLGGYVLLEKEEHHTMHMRMRLFGVSLWQQLMARLFVTLVISMCFAGISFYIGKTLLSLTLYPVDVLRIFLFMALYGVLLLYVFTFITMLINSPKVRLLVQSATLFAVIVLSGALVPTIYFPTSLQELLPYFFFNESFQWLIDLIVLERNYADYLSLGLQAAIGLLLLGLVAYGKERSRWGE